MASRVISCRRLSGVLLQTSVDVSDLQDLTTVRQLKAIFATADPVCPPVPWVSLLGHSVRGQTEGLVELSDSDGIPWAQLKASSKGMLTYIVRSPDLMAMVRKLLNEALYLAGGHPRLDILQHGVSLALPGRDGWLFPQILFYKPFCAMLESVMWYRLREEVRSEFWATLRFGLLNLTGEEANQIQHDGATILMAMARLCCDLNQFADDCAQPLENMVVEFLGREDLSTEMISSAVRMSWSARGPAHNATVSALILSLREKKPYRNGRSIGRGSMRVAHRIMSIQAEQAPDVLGCVTSDMFGDTMLQHILEPVSCGHAGDKSEQEARFCLSLVARMSLPQLRHRNREGICALSYAEQFATNTGWADWLQLRDALKHRMKSLSSQITSLPELLQHVQLLDQAAGSATDNDLETAHLEEVVLAARDVAWRLADQVRREWLGRGWRFRACAMPEQVEEVMQHFRSIV